MEQKQPQQEAVKTAIVILQYTVEPVILILLLAYANGWTSPYDASGKTLRYLAQPALNSVENVSSGATIKWKKVKGAAGYRIYRKKGSSAWQYVAAVSGENTKTYTDKKVKSKNGETYFYTVCAYNGNVKGTYHRTGKKIILSNCTCTE